MVRQLLVGLLYQSRTILMTVEQLVECEMVGETCVLGENLPLYLLVYHMTGTGIKP